MVTVSITENPSTHSAGRTTDINSLPGVRSTGERVFAWSIIPTTGLTLAAPRPARLRRRRPGRRGDGSVSGPEHAGGRELAQHLGVRLGAQAPLGQPAVVVIGVLIALAAVAQQTHHGTALPGG